MTSATRSFGRVARGRVRAQSFAIRRDELDPSGVEGLAAAGGIKRGAVQHQRAPSIGKFAQGLDRRR